MANANKKYAEYLVDVTTVNGKKEFNNKTFVKHMHITEEHAATLNRTPEVGQTYIYELVGEIPEAAEAAAE